MRASRVESSRGSLLEGKEEGREYLEKGGLGALIKGIN